MSRPSQLSQEHQIFRSLMKCPLCNKFPIIPNYFQHNGTKIRRNIAISDMDISTIAKCPRCTQSWSVFTDSPSENSNNCSEPNVPPNHTYSREILELSSFQIVEAGRREEALGSDRRIIDNSKSDGSVTRKLTMTKEWSKTYTVDFEKVIKAHAEANFNPLKLLVDFKTTIEGDLRKKYSISESIKNIYTDEVSVEIPPRSKIIYCFNWKQVWQNGTIKCLDKFDREVAFIPFKIVIGITFDLIAE